MKVQKLTITALLGAICIIMGLTPLGYFRLGIVEITLMCIPVIIGVILEGLGVGIILGLIFGLTSFAQIFMGSAFGMALFSAQPFFTTIIIFIPRLIVPIVTYWVYMGVDSFKKTNTALSTSIAAFAGSATNTVGFLTLVYLLMRVPFAEFLGISPEVAGATLITIATTNGIGEAIAAVVIATPVVIAVQKLKNK